jgi:LemA protein
VFNDKTRDYNTYIQQMPANFVASFRNFRPKPYFEATAGAERPPQVQFEFGNTNR